MNANANIETIATDLKTAHCRRCGYLKEFIFNGDDCQESCPTCKASPDKIMLYVGMTSVALIA